MWCCRSGCAASWLCTASLARHVSSILHVCPEQASIRNHEADDGNEFTEFCQALYSGLWCQDRFPSAKEQPYICCSTDAAQGPHLCHLLEVAAACELPASVKLPDNMIKERANGLLEVFISSGLGIWGTVVILLPLARSPGRCVAPGEAALQNLYCWNAWRVMFMWAIYPSLIVIWTKLLEPDPCGISRIILCLVKAFQSLKIYSLRLLHFTQIFLPATTITTAIYCNCKKLVLPNQSWLFQAKFFICK